MRALGHLPDPPNRRLGLPSRALVGAGLETLPDEVDLREHVRAVKDQRDCSGCVGFALAQAIEVRAALSGTPLHVSAKGIYALARELESPGSRHLGDGGSFPSRALEGLIDWGVVAHDRWPDDAPTEQPVPLDVLEAGAVAKLASWNAYRIDDTGADRVYRARQALSQGHPVCFAMLVDRQFEDIASADVYTGRVGKSLGGHYQCIVGYRPDALLVCGSWGTTWGFGGYAWLGIEAFESDEITDVQIIVASPTEVR